MNATTGTFTESGGAVYAQANPVTLSVTGAATWSGGQLQGGSGDILTLSQASGTTFTINGTAQAYLIGDTISTQSPVTISNPNFISTVNGSVAAALGRPLRRPWSSSRLRGRHGVLGRCAWTLGPNGYG